MIKGMSVRGKRVGRPREEGVRGRFQGRIRGKEWRPGKSGVRRAGGRTLVDQTRIRRGRAFRGQGLFEGVKRRLRLGWLRGRQR